MHFAKLFFLFVFVFPFAGSGQSVTVSRADSRIDGLTAPGYEVSFAAPASEVRSALTKYLKTMGRTRVTGDYITLSEPQIEGRKYTAIVYATTRDANQGCSAWIGPAPGSDDPRMNASLEQLAHDFGVTFHREQIQQQIDESLRALQAVERQQLRLTNQNNDLNNKVENNKKEKIRLEQSLVNNKKELDNLLNTLDANARARDSVAVAVEQIRKVVEMHRERQRRVK